MIACAKPLLCKEKLKLKYFNSLPSLSSFQTFITEIDLLLLYQKKYFKILVCNFVWDFLLLIRIRLKRGEKLFLFFPGKKTIFITIWIRWRFRQYLPQYNSDPHFFFLNPYRNKTFVILFSCGDIQYFLFCKVKKGAKSVSYAIYILMREKR